MLARWYGTLFEQATFVMMPSKTTLVLGASPKAERYSNQAVRELREHDHPVIALGRREGRIADVPIVTSIPPDAGVDTVTVYMNERNQEAWTDAMLALSPKRIIFNPGAENPDLAERAKERGIEVLEACTLVMLATGQY